MLKVVGLDHWVYLGQDNSGAVVEDVSIYPAPTVISSVSLTLSGTGVVGVGSMKTAAVLLFFLRR